MQVEDIIEQENFSLNDLLNEDLENENEKETENIEEVKKSDKPEEIIGGEEITVKETDGGEKIYRGTALLNKRRMDSEKMIVGCDKSKIKPAKKYRLIKVTEHPNGWSNICEIEEV